MERFPQYVTNAEGESQIVADQAAKDALGPGWRCFDDPIETPQAQGDDAKPAPKKTKKTDA